MAFFPWASGCWKTKTKCTASRKKLILFHNHLMECKKALESPQRLKTWVTARCTTSFPQKCMGCFRFLGHIQISKSHNYSKVVSPSRIPSKLNNTASKQKQFIECLTCSEVTIQALRVLRTTPFTGKSTLWSQRLRTHPKSSPWQKYCTKGWEPHQSAPGRIHFMLSHI